MNRKTITQTLVVLLAVFCTDSAFSQTKLQVVTTLTDYASLAKMIGEDRIEVQSIVHSVQDPHHIRPKPSFVTMVRGADLMVSTGLDLEMWLPTVINKSGNKKIRSGEIGYVAAAQGVELIEKPKVISQIEGDVHIFGNPHLSCSPIKMKEVARNIATGLIKNDPNGKALYETNLAKVEAEIDRRLFGEELVKLIGGDVLCRLADQDKLIDFLKDNKYQERPLIESLGGWMGKMLPLRGKPVVVYHKNWSYLIKLFGLREMGTIESKPGIPPSPKHVTNLITMMQEKDIKIILAANYFDKRKVATIAERTGAKPVISPLFVGGVPGTGDYFTLVDYWTDSLAQAAQELGM